jgi:tetratricopeptide (TPR) repeat protein
VPGNPWQRRLWTGVALVLALLLPPAARAQEIPSLARQREALIYFQRGQDLQRSGQPARAVELYRLALQTDPARLEVRPYLALALDQVGRWAEALEQYDLYLAQEPRDWRVRLNRAATLVHLERYQEALEELQALAPFHAGQPVFHNLRGLALLRLGQAQKAVEELEAAGSYPPARVNLALARLALGQGDEALALLQETVAASPGEAQTLNDLGLALAAQGRLAEALEALSAAARAGLAEAAANRVAVLERLGRLDEALLEAADLVDLHPQMARSRLLYGLLLYRRGRLEEAIPELLRAREDQSMAFVAGQYLGLLYLSRGEAARARELFEEGVLLEPGSPEAHHNLSQALLRLGENAEATDEARAAVELAPDRPELWLALGVASELEGNPEQAAEAYRAYLELGGPQSEQVGRHLEELEEFLTRRGR